VNPHFRAEQGERESQPERGSEKPVRGKTACRKESADDRPNGIAAPNCRAAQSRTAGGRARKKARMTSRGSPGLGKNGFPLQNRDRIQTCHKEKHEGDGDYPQRGLYGSFGAV